MGADQSREETEGSDHAASKMKSPEKVKFACCRGSVLPITTKAWQDADCRAAGDIVALRGAVALRSGRRRPASGVSSDRRRDALLRLCLVHAGGRFALDV